MEAAAFGDMARLKEACEGIRVKEISLVRAKLEIPKEVMLQMFGKDDIQERYKPKNSWNPALYAIAASKVEVLKYLFGTLKSNPKVCLSDHHYQSDSELSSIFGLLLSLQTYQSSGVMI